MKSYTVRNAEGQSFDVDEDKIGEAEKDGYLPVVNNGVEEHRVSFSDLAKAEADGYSAQATSDVSPIESGVMGAAKGASFGFAPAIAGGLEAAGSMIGVRGLGGKFSDTRLESDEEDKQSLGDIYRGARDAKKNDYKEAHEANPAIFTTGEIGGAVATSFAPGMGFLNAGKGASAAAVIGKGALQGGIYGLGDSDADLTKGEFGDAARDVAKGAALGGAGAGVIHGGMKGAGYVGEKIANTKTWQAIEDYISTLPEKVQAAARRKAVEALNPILSQQERLQTSGQLDKVGQEILDNNILQNKLGLPAGIKGIHQNLEASTDAIGKNIGDQLKSAQAVVPEFRVTSKELSDAIKEKAVVPNIQTPFWKGAKAVASEADEIESWGKEWTLPELNDYKSELGKRIKTWGSDNLSDKKVYEDMYRAVNETVEKKLNELTALKHVAGDVPVDQVDDVIERAMEPGQIQKAGAQMLEGMEKGLKDFKASKSTYGALEQAEKIAKKASAREAKNNDWGLTTWLSALMGSGIGTAGGPGGMLAGAAIGVAARQASRGYGNQTMALFLNKLSKAPASIAKLAPVLEKYSSQSPQALSTAIYVLAKDKPEFQEWLNNNPPETSQPGKLQARDAEAGIESEGLFDLAKPYKQTAAKKLAGAGHENVGWALENLTPDSPLDVLPTRPAGPAAGVIANGMKKGEIDILNIPAKFLKGTRTIEAEGKSLGHKIYEAGDNIFHNLLDGRKTIAQISGQRVIDENGIERFMVKTSASNTPGAGRKLYEAVASEHGGLISDVHLSPEGSHKVYADHLSKNPALEVELAPWGTTKPHKVDVVEPEAFRQSLGVKSKQGEPYYQNKPKEFDSTKGRNELGMQFVEEVEPALDGMDDLRRMYLRGSDRERQSVRELLQRMPEQTRNKLLEILNDDSGFGQ